MKIAIQANPSRGKEIISLLESLGGSNPKFKGDGEIFTYYIDKNNIIQYNDAPKDYKVYTLEEFEKEFPFKVGDLCIYQSEYVGDIVVKVLRMIIQDNDIVYEIGHKDTDKTYSGIYRRREILRPYKEMKEERNITLTLEKAKEWYKKGGELKEIALQAFSKQELNPLPKNWVEFCINNAIKLEETYIGTCSKFIGRSGNIRDSVFDRNVCPSKKSAEAHLAMIQLEQLRNCWWGDWKPEWKNNVKYVIKWEENNLITFTTINIRAFLVFPTQEMAKEFLECFRYLIEQAGDLI